ncbi:MAG: hypothetical protein ACREPM_13560 [Gemmatimonadaceae bacterium]
MDDDTQRRALSGALGPEAQRLELARIAAEVPESAVLTPRQKRVAVVVLVLLATTVIALSVIKLAVPATLARHAR